jgi:mannonate dehydratase
LRQMIQLGVDCLDFGGGEDFPGVKEQGYPDLDAVLQIKRRIASWGMEINRVTLPDVTDRIMRDQPGGEEELEHIAKALQVYGEAGIRLARQRFAGDFMPNLSSMRTTHRGGYVARADSAAFARDRIPKITPESVEDFWAHFCRVFERLVPVADEYGIKLAVHPSDTPYPDTPFGALGMHRIIDAFPSKQVGFVYCIGTRAEAGGTPLVLDEIHQYGRKGRLFMCHFRNIRGSLATSGGFEEVLLDDGDMNMFKVLLALDEVGFDGCLNPDHIQALEGDAPGASLGLAYSVGYIKALLAALAALPKRGYL